MKLFSAFTILSCLFCLFVASPISEVCNRRLNVLLLGHTGSGKSTIVNVLHGLCDLKLKDKREIAKKGNQMGYDTPGFEDNEAKNNQIASLISEKVLGILKDGFDAFFFLFPVNRTPDARLANQFNFITSLITKKGYKQGVIVFTFADTVEMTEDEEKLKIDELKNKMLKVAPQAEDLLNSVKYIFYRHTTAQDKDGNTIFFPETWKHFLTKAYSNVYKNCVNNNGNTFSTQAMIEAKRKYEENKKELDALQKEKDQLRLIFIVSFPLGDKWPQISR
ncbi:hypothetical protein ROZALSC1DRAFT_28448 [Rozella allomycis CSF55]|uniref:AIG1-type G domain-containing protein n=1 Tax=Rozella allomycis (strain CSF55) TaxID=988480 RepID=A0A075AXG3_ROZAC|nr:hypothetical protein O9G_004350 [Rozella allomycis CSF55]RKP20013.1 hypothetical protein ROZALSC1DRAFT_28448 [Rozella allomycis CSF55]|eukprot:EPZ35000.1 hypothetical protein O9G_004350 [Rozella allomycis CSF55]